MRLNSLISARVAQIRLPGVVCPVAVTVRSLMIVAWRHANERQEDRPADLYAAILAKMKIEAGAASALVAVEYPQHAAAMKPHAKTPAPDEFEISVNRPDAAQIGGLVSLVAGDLAPLFGRVVGVGLARGRALRRWRRGS